MTGRTAFTDRQVLALAVVSWLVAIAPVVPPALAAVVGVTTACGALVDGRRRPGWVVAVVVALVALHAGITREALAATGPAGPLRGRAVLVDDPVGGAGSAVAAAELDGRRVELRATGPLARSLRQVAAGESVAVEGRFRPRRADERRLADRHVLGRLDVTGLDGWRPAAGPSAWVNAYRSLLWRGAVSLDDRDRALFAGLVYGDDRALAPADEDAFVAAGLTHLTAVSGQNVAFVLAVLGPLLRRLRHGARTLAVPLVLVAVAMVTRAEPSVLRAVVMAGLAGGAVAVGADSSGRRHLGLAVTGLLVVDPLLARRAGFALSVAASLGILVGARALAARLRGPRPWREALGVTVAAQVATAPLLAAWFGGVPVGSLPANVLAGPVAGLVMMYGLAAGTAAGVAAAAGWGPLAALLHRPTGLLLGLLRAVATGTAQLDVGVLALPAVLTLLGVGTAALLVRARAVRLAATVVAIGVVGLAAAEPWRPAGPLVGAEVALGVRAWRASGERAGAVGVLVLDGRADPGRVLSWVREARVRWIELVVVRSEAARARAVADVLTERLAVGTVLAPGGPGGGRAPPVAPPVSGWSVRIEATGSPWAVTVEPVGASGASG